MLHRFGLRLVLLFTVVGACLAPSFGGPRADQQDAPSTGAEVATDAPDRIRNSLFASPLYFGESPPEVRAVRHVQLVHVDALGAARNVDRTLEEALELARSLRRALLDGADFSAVARRYSSAPDAPLGGVLGSFPPGVLQEDLDAFLFSADLGQISEPIATPTGIHVLQRIERLAGCRVLLVAGSTDESRVRAESLRAVIADGADFAEVAAAESEDPVSAARGGALAVFERGPADRLVKAAVFELEVGEVSAPIDTPYGWYLVQRVPVDDIPKELAENNWYEFRGLALLHSEHTLPLPLPDRTSTEAAELASELGERLAAGADLGDLAVELDDDPSGGRERRGYIGWVHRRQPSLPPFMHEAFRLEPGGLLGPQATNVGWVFVERLR
ncbi:peptidylprolyl isomerase [Rohdeia mirabilis]